MEKTPTDFQAVRDQIPRLPGCHPDSGNAGKNLALVLPHVHTNQSRIVIMGACVHDTVLNIVMWQELIVWCAPPGKLKDFHPRQVETVAQLHNIRSDHAQIFGDDR